MTYKADEWTNISPKIQSRIGLNHYLRRHHPLSLIRQQIVDYFYKSFLNSRGNPVFSVVDNLSPVVTVQQNFDSLLIPKDHVSRRKNDCYYINKDYILRGHTTAHQVDMLRSGLDNFLLIGDVYRRDEIDATHYPVFHQIDAARTLHRDKLFENNIFDLQIFEKNNGHAIKPSQAQQSSSGTNCIDDIKQPCHTIEAVKLAEHELKTVLLGLVEHLFGQKLEYRWVDAHFPFTQPSWELEIFFNGKWIEVLGSGIMRNEILENSGMHNSIGWAFGMGLERLAMILYNIPDIRLFWCEKRIFLRQFHAGLTTEQMQYKPITKLQGFPLDISFWLPEEYTHDTFPVNDFYELVRELAGDTVEEVIL